MTDAGTGLEDAVYTNQALSGGSGSSATADITVSGGTVTSWTVNTAGSGYSNGETLSVLLPSATIPGTGEITGISSFSGGTGLDLADDSYVGLSGTGGSGSSATFNVTVASGNVIAAAINNGGSGYVAGEQITLTIADLGSGTGTSLVIDISGVSEDVTPADQTVTATITTN